MMKGDVVIRKRPEDMLQYLEKINPELREDR